MTPDPSDEIRLVPAPGRHLRVLVGDSVYEQATVTLDSDGRLYVEFDAEDLDAIMVDLGMFYARPRGGS